jgi:glycosyltransferase involved in cell wall biosynthesis
MSQAPGRGEVCVLLVAAAEASVLERCLASLRKHTPADVQIVQTGASSAEVNEALDRSAPADVIVIEAPCLVEAGWLERMREAAYADTNTATASAMAESGTPLALGPSRSAAPETAAERGEQLLPRLSRAVGPCVYVRREALELVGQLDEQLELKPALELDLAQRCLRTGLFHVAADEVVVVPLDPGNEDRADGLSPGERASQDALLNERYPYLAETPLARSPVLAQVLLRARETGERLDVTLDARSLEGAITGTQVHVLELIVALARTQALRLRVLIWRQRIDRMTLELLRGLPDTEILAVEDIEKATPRSAVFHRPQQAFSEADVALAHSLGERVVLSQLDLIAYSNPSYFPDVETWEAFRRASRHGISAAERVVVFSAHTRRELVRDALVEEERVKVVPPGLDHRLSGEGARPAALDGAAEELAERGFLLCLGTDFAHKNRLFALRLLASLRDEHGWDGALLLAGTHIANGSSQELERAYLQQHPSLDESVIELGAVSEQEKTWLLAHTSAVVYPSVYEGFGLVPFESALSGVPCVFAALSSLAEAAPAGTATILPWDVEASAAAVHTLLSDKQARERHVRALTSAARELTWAKAATSMIEIYREAVAAPPRTAAQLSRDASESERVMRVAHQVAVDGLIAERELVLGDYNRLLEELGPGRGLIGPKGSLPEELQRALLALSARPALSRALFSALSRVFMAARALARAIPGSSRGSR